MSGVAAGVVARFLASIAAAVRRYDVLDRALFAWSVIWTAGVLVAFGLVSAIIPNPAFGRGTPPEPFAIAVWLASAPLMGFVLATYFAPPPGASAALTPAGREGRTTGTLGGIVAFLAIGCPTCNKVALLLLGAGGATNVFGPIQPVLGGISLVLLAATVALRLRVRGRGGACDLPAR